MQSNVMPQIIEFFNFVLIGIILALVFDFFRAYRKYKGKSSNISIIFQDILYFFIATIIIVISLVYVLNSSIRAYIFLAIILGIMTYITVLSSYIMKIYCLVISSFLNTVKFIFLPIILQFSLLKNMCNFLIKYIKKCCKKFFYMIFFICKGIRFTKGKKDCKQKRFFMKKVDKDKRGKGGKLKLSIIVPIIFLGYCIYTLFDQQMQINKYDSQIKFYQNEIDQKNEMVGYYNEQKNNVNSDEYIEKVARESLGLVKPYEKVFVDANK